MTKNGMRTFDARAAVVSLSASGGAGRTSSRVRYCDWSYGTPHRPSAPTTSSPRCARSADLAPPAPPRVTRLAQGPLDDATGDGGRPTGPPTGPVGI